MLNLVVPEPSKLRQALLPKEGDSADGVVRRALQAVRSHLGLQVAYVSEIIGDGSIFRTVDAPGLEHLIKVGDRRSLDDVYCRHILEGRLPELIPDTAAEPLAMSMAITAAVPIGVHVSVPLRLADGQVYGMFCCLGPQADPSLNQRDVKMMKAFAALAAFEIQRERATSLTTRASESRIREMIDGEAIQIVYQPIWSLEGKRPVGFECLSRFPGVPQRSPDKWFAEAAVAGMSLGLELAAIRAALAGLDRLPDDVYLAVNASPSTAVSSELADLLAGYPLARVVLEITEHDAVDDFESLSAVLAPLRARGLRIAVDDPGAGYSGLQQILQIRPELIKLDRSLIQDIGTDPGRLALAAALTMFARETGSRIVAEGVETETELAMLRALGVHTVQGYLLGRPQPIESAVALFERMRPLLVAV